MERKEFLRSLGAGAAFALTFPCLGGCTIEQEYLTDEEIAENNAEEPSEDDNSPDDTTDNNDSANNESVLFTIDLDSTEGAKIADNGDYIIKNEVVVAKNLEGKYAAASQICSHEPRKKVSFLSDDGGIFRCSDHGARFNQNGKPLNSVTSKYLKVYDTKLENNILSILA